MKIRIAATAAVLLSAAVLTTPAAAQNPAGANAPKFGVAVVDINYIFKEHKQFRAKMDVLKDRMKSIEGQLENDRKQLMTLEERKKSYNPDAPEFLQIDEQITKMKADVQIKMTRLRKDFLEDEADAYYETYQQVNRTIAGYAKHYKIGLVLRFNGAVADPANRQSILAEINKPVQYQDSIDITPDILSLVNPASVGQGASGVRR
ncbi:MAG: OmpH family outer membrane protein [Planctomycetota bacterium]